jgi:hypothetical protein
MARIYREIVVEQMVLTVEEAMSPVIGWWGDLPPSMKDAIHEFRAQVGAAIDSVEFVKKALDTPAPDRTARIVSLQLPRWKLATLTKKLDFRSPGRRQRL